MKKTACILLSPLVMTVLTFAAVTVFVNALDNIVLLFTSDAFAAVIKQFESAALGFPFAVPLVSGLCAAYPVYRFASMRIPFRVLTVIGLILLFIATLLLTLWFVSFNGIGVSVIVKILMRLFSGGVIDEMF